MSNRSSLKTVALKDMMSKFVVPSVNAKITQISHT